MKEKNMIFNDLHETLKSIIIKALKTDPDHRIVAIKEGSYYISHKIKDLLTDTFKFDIIVEQLFNESVCERLSRIPTKFEAELQLLKEKFPETEPLKRLIISLEFGDHFGHLGKIDDFNKLDKFKMTLYLDAIMYLQLGTETLHLTEMLKQYSQQQLQILYIGVKRTMIHEFSHILDSFQVDMEELLKDFKNKEYADQESELKAHECAFLYQLWKDGFAELAQEYNNVKEYEERIKKLGCWSELGPAGHTELSKKRYDQFLEKIYHYFRNEHNILQERNEGTISRQRYTVAADIKRGNFTQSELKWATEVAKKTCPETFGLIPKPDFFERDRKWQVVSIYMWQHYKHLMRQDLIDEIEHYIKTGKLKIKDYEMSPTQIRSYLDGK